jgi:hypothetical protein
MATRNIRHRRFTGGFLVLKHTSTTEKDLNINGHTGVDEGICLGRKIGSSVS